MFNVEFKYERPNGLVVFINGVRHTRNFDLDGCRFKVSFEWEGKKYFLKADDDQTPEEIEVIENAEPEDSEFFIPILAHGKAEYTYVRGDGTEQVFSVFYMIQEHKTFSKPYAKMYELWPHVESVAAKYNLLWDLDTDFRNWAVDAETGHAVLYDAAPEQGW